MRTAVEKAQAVVTAWLGEDLASTRRWIGPARLDSYESPLNSWRASLWVLEGSPPRGFVIETASVVIALDMLGKRKRVYTK